MAKLLLVEQMQMELWFPLQKPALLQIASQITEPLQQQVMGQTALLLNQEQHQALK